MALFSRTPARKPWAPRVASDARAVQPSGVTGTVTGFGLTDAAPTRRIIEVSQGGGDGLPAVLENAALLYASGHADSARATLTEGLDADPEAGGSQFTWLALFDLLQRAGDRDAYDRLALRYVVAFECTAPLWDDASASPAPRDAPPGGYVGLAGKLTAAHAAQLNALATALAGHQASARLDLVGVTEFDDAGARLLGYVLAKARQERYHLELQRPENLLARLDLASRQGREGGEGAWLLLLELLQWQGDQHVFDERAIDYAVTFEVSPPSWEPPVAVPASDEPAQGAAADEESLASPAGVAAGDDAIAWAGIISGAQPEVVDELARLAAERTDITLDLSRVERIDFAAAGSCFNAIRTLEGRGKSVRIVGATPVIEAMLRLLGLGPKHFQHYASHS